MLVEFDEYIKQRIVQMVWELRMVDVFERYRVRMLAGAVHAAFYMMTPNTRFNLQIDSSTQLVINMVHRQSYWCWVRDHRGGWCIQGIHDGGDTWYD